MADDNRSSCSGALPDPEARLRSAGALGEMPIVPEPRLGSAAASVPGAPELADQPEVAPAYGQSRSIVLHPGEATEFLASLPSGMAQLVITSPPYNLGKAYESRVSLEDYAAQQAPVLDQIVRVLGPRGSLCWQVGNYVSHGEVVPLDVLYYPLFKQRGLKLRNRIVWHFEHGLHCARRFSGRYETILWFTKSDDYYFDLDPVRVPAKYPGKRYFRGPRLGQLSGNPLGKNPSDLWTVLAEDWEREVWEIPNVKANHPEKTVHPCQYPIELVERCLLALTAPGDWVVDPFCGVGSTLLAGVKHGRRVAGSELDSDYVAIARERIAALLDGRLAMRELDRPVHAPSGRDKTSRFPEEWRQVSLDATLAIEPASADDLTES